MSRNFLTGLNLNKNELLNARLQNLAVAPSNPVVGQFYFDTAIGTTRQWNGTAWIDFLTSADGNQFISSVDDGFVVSNGQLSLDLATGLTINGSGKLAIDSNYYYDKTGTDSAISNALEGYATESFVTTQGYLVSSDLSGYATESFVTTQGYLVSSDLSGYATETFVNNLIGDNTVDGSAGNTVHDRIASAISGLAPNYITSVGSNLDVTDGELTLGSDVVITSSTQLLSNKTFTGDVYFQSAGQAGGSNNYITVGNDGHMTVRSGYELELESQNNVNITSNGGDIVLNADGTVYLGSVTSGNEVVATGWSQTLTNKTIDGAIVTGTTSFRDGSNVEGLTIDISGIGTAHLIATDDLSLRATNDIVLYPGNDSYGHTGKAYIHWGNDATSAHPEREIATIGTSQVFTNKTIGDGGVAFNDGTTQYGNIYNDGGNNLVIDGSNNDVILTSDSGYAYIGSNTDPSTRIATWDHVSAVASGLNVKESVRVASITGVSNLASVTAVDGVTLADGDRVLLKNQGTASQNGIYVFTLSTTTLSRAADQLTPEKGDYVFVEQGTNAARGFIVTDVTGGITWTQFSAAGEYTAGDGIDISGNAISVKLDSDSLSESGSGLKVNLAANGGIDNDGGLYVKTGTGLVTDGGGNVAIDTDIVARKYSEANGTLTATSGSVSWVVEHGLGTRNVTIQVFDLDTYEQVEVDVIRTSTSVVTLSWVSSGVTANSYQVVVVG